MVQLLGRRVGSSTIDKSYPWKKACAVFVDAVGYSTRIEKEPEKTRHRLKQAFSNLISLVENAGGRVIDTAGDGLFAEFADVGPALHCIKSFQNTVALENEPVPIDHRMRFRCGIAYGDVMQEEHLISGPPVNIAARLQQLAEPGTTNVDDEAHRQIESEPGLFFADIGFRILKGLSNPVRVWRVIDDVDDGPFMASAELADEYKSISDDPESWIADARGIAVLPFEVPPGKSMEDEEDAYMALGLASDIADGMAKSHWLKVISPRSSMNYSDERYADNEIAKELGVRYLVKGRVRVAGETVRISASLIDCSSGHTFWSENYDRRDKSIFDIQDEIAHLIIAKIEPEFLRHESERAADNRPRNVNAWDLLMRARWHFWRGTAKHVKMALGCGEKALLLDPDNAQTLALLSFCHMTEVWAGLSSDPKFQTEEALRFARLAVNLDETNPNAHFTMGTALSLVGEVAQAIAAERRALELNPNFVGAMGELARLLAFDGRAEEARRAALKAIEISPSDPHISLFVRSLAIASFIEEDYSGAANFAIEATAKRPDWFFHHAMVASCQALAGNMGAAKLAMAECMRLLPNYPISVLKTGHPFTDPEHMDRFLEGLHLAGWQEG